MQHALVVRVAHRVADLEDHLQRPRQVPVVASVEGVGEALAGGLALHHAHGEVDLAGLVEPEFVHRHDARMVELARHLRFFEEAAEQLVGQPLLLFVARRAALQQHLHREPPVEELVVDLQHEPHAAPAQFAIQREALLVELGRLGQPRHQLAGRRRLHALAGGLRPGLRTGLWPRRRAVRRGRWRRRGRGRRFHHGEAPRPPASPIPPHRASVGGGQQQLVGPPARLRFLSHLVLASVFSVSSVVPSAAEEPQRTQRTQRRTRPANRVPPVRFNDWRAPAAPSPDRRQTRSTRACWFATTRRPPPSTSCRAEARQPWAVLHAGH